MGTGWEVNDVKLWAVLEDIELPEAIGRLIVNTAGKDVADKEDLGEPEDGQVELIEPILDVSRYSDSFAVNTIPTANLNLALGRLAGDVTRISILHGLRDFMTQRLKVSVYAQVTQKGQAGGGVGLWTGRPFRVFDGYTAGCAYHRSPNGVELTLSLVHWLDDLTRSSSVSSISSPQSPGAMAFPAAMRFTGRPGPQGTNFSTFTGQTAASNHINERIVNADMWAPGSPYLGLGLQGWLLSLTETEAIRFLPLPRELSRDQGFTTNATNRAAAAAIRRFETTPTRIWSVPLAFRTAETAGSLALHLVRNIVRQITSASVGSLFGTTLWDVLLDLGSRFGFAVIPMVETALVVPFVKGLRETSATIRAQDYAYTQKQYGPPRTLRAVAIYGQQTSFTGQIYPIGATAATAVQNTDNTIGGVGGWFQGDSQGQILWFQAPPWTIANCAMPQSAALTLMGRSSAATPARVMDAVQIAQLLATPVGTGPASGTTAVSMLGTVAASLTEGNEAPSKVQASADVARNCMDAYAHLLYMNEVLSHRQLSIGGALRFDIAPGSSIFLEGAGELFIAGSDVLGGDQYATVIQVSTTIATGGQPMAVTAMHLTHVRSALENKQDATSILEHPFWQDAWVGGVLIEKT